MAIPGDKYLIDVEDIKRFRPLAEVDAARINPYILEAQSHDLRPILGDALYSDFMKNFDNTNVLYDHYRDLLNGKEYTYQGYTVAYEGLREMLAYFTLHRFVVMNGIHFSRFGTVRKLNGEKSEPVSTEELRMVTSDLKSNGIRAASLVTKYLIYNSATYPLYPQGPVPNQNRLQVKWFDL